MNANDSNGFAGDFHVFRLVPFLSELGCDKAAQTRVIAWFWRASKSWDAATQSEFDELARLQVSAKVKADREHTAYIPPVLRRPKFSAIQAGREKPRPPGWTPCKHHDPTGLLGYTRRCSTCQRRDAAELAARMLTADAMFQRFRGFVIDRIHAESQSRTGGKPYPEFDDLESAVWHKVSAQIETYKGTVVAVGPLQDGQYPMEWLKIVTHSAVNDWFKGRYAVRRDDRKTLELDSPSMVPTEPLPIQATAPVGSPDEEPDEM